MFSTFFINRPIFATVLSILIVIAGLVSLRGLPVEQYPTITPPTVVVRASYPGANASTIADMVGTPIEQQVNGVEGMLYMSSTSSSTGSYQLTITFEVGTDLDMATVLVENRVNMALSTLPQEVTQIGVTTTKESTNVVMFLSLTSDSPQYDALFLSNYAALNITNELGRVKGVGNVGLFGMGKYSMRIWLDPDQLTIRGITPADIVSAIQGQNIQVTAGSVGSEPLVRKEAYQYTLETKGLLIDEEEFGNIIVKALPDGKYLRIRDLATIELGRESYSSTATLKGGAVAAIAVYQLPGANALDVAQRVKKEMDKLQKNLGGIKNMTRVPDAIFVVDPKKERICVQEAHALGITLIGIGDTNCDPEELDYIIPGNDDAIRAVKLIVSKMADAVIEAKQGEAVYSDADVATEAEDIEEVAADAE